MNLIFDKHRIDYILIWNHGMQYFNDILNNIRSNKNFKIIKIYKHKPKNIKKLVKEIYSFDYAPFRHLKAKTKYLLKKPGDVCFIFIKNLNPDEDYLGDGNFRHKESLTLKKFKDKMRLHYNPYKNGKMTHNHVIYATSSEVQTNQILCYLGYKDGVKLFKESTKIIDIPYYIKGYDKLEIIQLDTNEIYCNIAIGNAWDDCNLITVKVDKSPHYIGLTQNIDMYKNYISKYLGGPLQSDYNLSKYIKLSGDFKYLSAPYKTSFVIVHKIKNKFLVLDGLHRISNYIKQGHRKIKVCQLK